MLDMTVRNNILRVKERIALACSRVSGDASSVKIIAVSKGRTAEQVLEAAEAGIGDIGENRVQEAGLKYHAVGATPYAVGVKWHMVGHLQTNKVKDAVTIFNLIHSVDSLRLAQEISRQAGRINKVQDILVEVKTSPEATKFGLKPDEITEVIEKMSELKNINVKGLMTIAPMADDPENARPYFRQLRELRDKINAIRNTQYAIRELSMGMTDDFEAAIEEGSTMVRIGRAIFEG
jgi:pyridoxal phosphate enzyme (YggS family)